MLRGGRHDAAHFGAALTQSANEIEALISGNPAGDDQ
jgi:hypothetical protein